MKTKSLSLLPIAALLIGILAGCGSANGSEPAEIPGVVTNSEYSETTMKTLDGTEVDVMSTWNDGTLAMLPEAGMGVVAQDSWNAEKLFFSAGHNELNFMFMSSGLEDAIAALGDDASEEEITAAMEPYILPVFSVFRCGKADSEAVLAGCDARYACRDTLAVLGGDTYYLGYNNDFTTANPNFSEDEIADLNAIAASMENASQFVLVFPAQEASNTMTDYENAFQTFTDTDLEGNAVTQAVFENYDLTIVNIWATWCGPCVSEMKDLEELHQSLPENANIIGICIDALDSPDTAKQILADNGVTFTQLTGSGELQDDLLNYIMAVPTTLFIASDGSIVGDPIEGAMSAQAYLRELEARMG